VIRKEAIVVGGGMAGLTATAYLARAGRNVLLLEKNEKCGGLVNSFTKEGFLFEGGVRALLSAGIILPMLRELEISLDFVPSPVSVGVEDQIIHVEDLDDIVEYAAMLKALYPDDPDQVDRLIGVVQRVMRDMKILYGVENPLFHNFLQDKVYFFRNYIPWFFKFAFTLYRINHMRGPVEDFLAALLPNRSLRDIVDQHFFRATPAFFALSYFYLYTDYFYPKGGVGQLAQKVTQKVLDLGGEIQLETRVVKIDITQRLLEDEQGSSYAYDDLIWAADLKTLYRMAKYDGLPGAVQDRIEQEKSAILASRGTDSVFTLYLGLNEPPETYRSELKDMLQNWAQVSREDVLSWLDRFFALNTYEISIPVLKDPAAAPAGKTGLIVSTLFEYDLVKKVRDDGWYPEFKSAAEERMIAVLAGSIYPWLKDQIENRFSASPLTIENTAGSSEGSIVGWSFEGIIPVTNSLLQVNDSVKTAFPHVLKAGQWSYSPNGVPTAILTGRLAADKV
jgi:phytoene dehydrogenase-like protein